MEPVLNMWTSVVSLAGCVTGSFKTDFDRVLETDIVNGELFGKT